MNFSQKDLVSVIVPFLNGSNWLIEALESVINQTYTNWEIILMDDGSDEEHTLIAKEFSKKHHNKIFYAEHKNHVNKGVTISRNEAVKLSKGKYLAFLDADDIWLPEKLSQQLNYFMQNPMAQAVCSSSLSWFSWKDKTAENIEYILGAPEQLYHPCSLLKLLYPFTTGKSPCPSGIIIKRQAFDRINGFEPAYSGIYELYEDQAFLSKLYLSEYVFISGKINNWYRKRSDSMSSAAENEERYNKVRNFYFNWLENYMKQKGIIDSEINRLIRNAKNKLLATA